MRFRIRSEGKEALTLASMQMETLSVAWGRPRARRVQPAICVPGRGNEELCSRQSLHAWETAGTEQSVPHGVTIVRVS